MHNLIVSIVAVVLVLVSAGVSVFYGGSVWKEQGKNADAASLMARASQVGGAVEVYFSEQGSYPASMDDLVSMKYLSTPVPGTWTFEPGYVVTEVESQDACLALNKAQGINTIPGCGDTQYEGKTYCCEQQ